ncbi:MAG: hypothetical protein ACKOI0_02895 [Actinomycetota bacterium]
MPSAAPSPDGVLEGPVGVVVDRELLSLDRPFTYDLAADVGARLGSLVRVPFHRKLTHGWVIGPAEPVPRMLAVRDVLSPVPQFDERGLALLRWAAERYVAPLATLVARAVPPRVAGEESTAGEPAPVRIPTAPAPRALVGYRGGPELLAMIADGSGATAMLRPAPEEQVTCTVEVVAAALAAGRTAIVVVPEADPVPATARALREAFGDAVALFLGGDRRERYRTWLDVRAGRYAVVVGTRPAVWAPAPALGVIHVAREGHPQHREERSPHAHVREIAAARARLEGALCVLASLAPTLEARALASHEVAPAGRRGAPVELVRPGPEGRAPRLVRAIREARSGFLFEPMRGYGVARVCRACGEPATCGACRGLLRLERGAVLCAVCGAEGRCAICGAADFGIVRGGVERVEEWARGIAAVAVAGPGDPRPAGDGFVVGGLERLKDVGPVGVDLVGILSADAMLRRPGLGARERALVAWAEAAAWAGPDGRVVVQTDAPNDPAVQALVTGNPDRFARLERPRLEEAGFPAGFPVFRVEGSTDLEAAMLALPHRTLLTTSVGDRTVCSAVVAPDAVAAFASAARDLAARGVVTRVEAEPHL